MDNTNKIIGVLGGMGPDATVDFMAKVIAATPAGKDQDHVHMLVDHNPKVPDRQDAILRDGENPGPALAEMAARLEIAGADFMVIPCNSAHVFAGDVQAAVDIPLVSIIDATVEATAGSGARSAGILATDGCIAAGVIQEGLQAAGIKAIIPRDDELEELMALVNHIKAGYKGETVARGVDALAAALVERGAEAIIAGCTEIPLVFEQSSLEVPLISSTDVLAEKAVAIACGNEALSPRGL